MRSDEALYEQLIAGDLGAFDALYERYERPLFGFIRQHLADRAEAEDVLSETFLALVRDQRGRGQRIRSFKAWIYQVARNLCLNRRRAHQRAARAVAELVQAPPASDRQPERALLQREAALRLQRAVAALPGPLAEIYALRSGGLSYAELADVLELPLGTVKSRMHELVGRLRREMTT